MKRGVVLGSAFLLLAACESRDDALLRGDRYWADSNYVAALAEYRLAAKQHGGVEADARVAHAYIMTGQLDRARRAYETLFKLDPGWDDQAVFDYVTLARSSLQRGDRYVAARAAEAALDIRPDLRIPELSMALARHYATTGDAPHALQFYRRALDAVDPAARGALLYEIASLSERGGSCLDAVPYFKAYLEQSGDQDSITEARWRMGTCGFEQGRQARAAGEFEKALQLLQITLDLGAPQNLLDQAWFERGEALDQLGRTGEAADAFQRVIDLGDVGRTQLPARAARRLLEIRARQVP
jgi:tetratricopeptide (TPR) repeat protein